MKYIEFDSSKKYDLILLGRIAVDLNPVDYYCPLNESTTFKRYLGGSPANIAVGLARLGKKCGFFARVSDDQLGTFVTDLRKRELTHQELRDVKTVRKSALHLPKLNPKPKAP